MIPREIARRAELSDRWLSDRLDAVRSEVDAAAQRARIDLAAAVAERWPDGDQPVALRDLAIMRQIINAEIDAFGRALAGISIQARQDVQRRAVEDVARVWAVATSGEMTQIVDILLASLPEIPTDPAQHARDVGGALGRYATVSAVQRDSRAMLSRKLFAPKGSVFSTRAGRIPASLDVDAAVAYHAAAQTSMEVAAVSVPASTGAIEFVKRDVEIIDAKNHPISRVLNGQTVPIQAPFVARFADVEREAAAMGRSTAAGAVLWSRKSDAWVGLTLPAHYNERGRVQMLARSWLEG